MGECQSSWQLGVCKSDASLGVISVEPEIQVNILEGKKNDLYRVILYIIIYIMICLASSNLADVMSLL